MVISSAAAARVEPTAIESAVTAACLRLPPLWGLNDLVAVNPYLGYAGSGLVETEDAIQRRLHAAVLPTWDALRSGWRAGEFTSDDVRASHVDSSDALALPPVAHICQWLADETHAAPESPRCLSIAGVLSAGGYDWVAAVRDDFGRFAAARTDLGVGRWAFADAGGWWASWRAWMRHDHSMAVRGVRGLPAWVAALPAEASAARQFLLARLALSDLETEDYLGRLLGELQGWAGWLRQQAWPQGQDQVGDLPELLTIRLAMDLALHDLHATPNTRPRLPTSGVSPELAADRAARLVVVGAWERSYRNGLVRSLQPASAAISAVRPAVQAVFCIDVRSEGFRRQLEASDPTIESYGFAGFFAMPVAISGDAAIPGATERAQCPVLLAPGPQVSLVQRRKLGVGRLFNSFRRSAIGGFAYMESAGVASAWSLLRGSLGDRQRGITRRDEDADMALDRIPDDQRLALLRGMLANLGLAPPYARLVLLCGHDSTTANNPQGAALACGACGGHSGSVNARLAVRLYNDRGLRAKLGEHAPPADSLALAAVHDTTTDEVRIVDSAAIPGSHLQDLARLRQALVNAGNGQRTKRCPGLSALSTLPPGAATRQQFTARSCDWAELQPEWGLVDNAAFIAAPRSMTAHLDLEGRSFLHSYRADLDPNGSVLGLILTAPVVVASWINLQYWSSSVDPLRFGSGNKAIHSIVGGIGVTTGADGDLRQGLAWQSVHDGQRLRHRPARLQVFVAAAPERIDQVVAGHPHLRDLVSHGWLCLHTLDPATAACRRRLADGQWVQV